MELETDVRVDTGVDESGDHNLGLGGGSDPAQPPVEPVDDTE